MDDKDKVWEKLEDHELRIRQNTNDISEIKAENQVQNVKLQAFDKSIDKLVLALEKNSDKIQENIDKSQEQMIKILDRAFEVLGSDVNNKNEVKKEEVKVSNEIRINNNKQKWIVLGSIITGIISILVAIFK